MEKIKGVVQNYKFDLNDIRAGFTVLNLVLVILFGAAGCLLGFCIALVGVIRDIVKKKKVNSYIIHISNCILNIYLMILLTR